MFDDRQKTPRRLRGTIGGIGAAPCQDLGFPFDVALDSAPFAPQSAFGCLQRDPSEGLRAPRLRSAEIRDAQVNRGKPYGFHRKDNCGNAYFPIEFQLTNAAGFGDYTTGFPVQCQVQENPTTALGSTSEPLLAAYRLSPP